MSPLSLDAPSNRWNDGSNLGTSSPSASSPLPDPPTPSEPFLLAGDTDLEEDMHQTDPSGGLYLRPYSRVFLAEKFQVLGVPNVAVYHLEKREMLSTQARLDLMKGDKAEGTWEKWEKGERISFSASGEFESSVFERKLTLTACNHRPRLLSAVEP